jgi:hypothetical protein
VELKIDIGLRSKGLAQHARFDVQRMQLFDSECEQRRLCRDKATVSASETRSVYETHLAGASACHHLYNMVGKQNKWRPGSYLV